MSSDINQIVDDKLVTFLALRSFLAESSQDAGRRCCAACGATSPLVSVAPGVFGCRDCLDQEAE